MDRELIRTLVENLSRTLGDHDVPAQQQIGTLQCQLLMLIYEKLGDIESRLDAIDRETHPRLEG